MAKYDPDEFFDRKSFTMCRDCVYPAKRENGLYCTKNNAHIAGIGGCRDGKEKLPTNADRIRAMSDEELAEWLAEITDCADCKIYTHATNVCMTSDEACACAWLDWLRQEAVE